jgi:hypothetical protein
VQARHALDSGLVWGLLGRGIHFLVLDSKRDDANPAAPKKDACLGAVHRFAETQNRSLSLSGGNSQGKALCAFPGKTVSHFSWSCSLIEHDLFRKPVSIFRDHTLAGIAVG